MVCIDTLSALPHWNPDMFFGLVKYYIIIYLFFFYNLPRLIWFNVGKNHLQFHHSYRWYKPFPVMDGLWHFSNINHPLITITKLILYLYIFILYGGFPRHGTWTPKWSKKLRLANKRPTSPTSENVFWRPAIDPMPVRRSRGPAYDWEDWEDWDKGSWPQGFPEVFNIRGMGLT